VVRKGRLPLPVPTAAWDLHRRRRVVARALLGIAIANAKRRREDHGSPSLTLSVSSTRESRLGCESCSSLAARRSAPGRAGERAEDVDHWLTLRRPIATILEIEPDAMLGVRVSSRSYERPCPVEARVARLDGP
jgi:hypothetical protein